MKTALIVYTAQGVARIADKSEGWGRLVFKRGTVPTEVLINGKYPAVTAPTLDRMSASLKAMRRGVWNRPPQGKALK
jgi:hypothetical protein